jgi:hypothetical protein
MPQKSPLSLVNDAFGAKDKLVDKLVTLLDRGEEPKADLRKRLLAAANSKLLNLHRVATAVKEKFGSRDKLVAQAASLLGHSKDKDFVARLDNQSNAPARPGHRRRAQGQAGRSEAEDQARGIAIS